MSIFSHKNDDSVVEQKGRYIGGVSERINLSRELCERSGEASGVSGIRKRWKGVVMERVLKLLGYHEKTANAHEAIKSACLLNVDFMERIEKVKATLDGEYEWFKEEDRNEPASK
jgi:hypothetical protein